MAIINAITHNSQQSDANHSNITGSSLSLGVPSIEAKARFYGVPIENPVFVDRPGILASMEIALSSPSNGCQTLALKGLGGMGKSQLMLRYCYLHRAAYEFIIWLEVGSWSTAVESLTKLAINLGFDPKEKDSAENSIEWVRSWFQGRTNWLLLLNNYDGGEMDKKIFELLPRFGGNIIMTTRLNISSQKATVIHVDKLQEKEALFLLLGISSIDSIDKKSTEFDYARRITAELDYMPLAIVLACAYVQNTSTSFQRYLSMFQERSKCVKLFQCTNNEDINPYKHIVTTVWQLSILTLNPVAFQILEACSFLQPENIPVRFFKQQYSALQLESASAVSGNEQLSDDIETAVTALVKFSFVTRMYNGMENDLLIIHRPLQKVLLDSISNERILRWVHCIPAALRGEIDFSNVHASHTRKAMNIYLSHIRYLATFLCNYNQQSMSILSSAFINLLNDTNTYLWHNRMYFDMVEAEQLLIKLSKTMYGLDHINTANSLNVLAQHYDSQGRYEVAESLYQRALAIRESVVGSEHPNTAMTLNGLARFYVYHGKYDEAEPLYQRALTIYEKVLISEHPSIARTLNDLARLYVRKAKYDEAGLLYQRALAIREKVLGPEHPDTATSLDDLARLCHDKGKYDEVEPLYQRALAIREKVLGSEHPSTAMTLNGLAGLYVRYGRYDEAELLYQRALAIYEKVLRSEHLSTAMTLNDLAGLYVRQAKYDEAGLLYQRALAIRGKVLGPEHPDTAASLNSLASHFDRQGKYDMTEPLYQRALAILEKVLGSEHPSIAMTLNGLAGHYKNQGKYDKAEPLYQRALAICEKVLGPEHPNTAIQLNNLALHYNVWGKYDEAEPLYQRVLVINEKVLRPEHPNTAITLSNLARLYVDQERFDEAEPLYRRSLAIHEKVLGLEHSDTVMMQKKLAKLYKSLGKLKTGRLATGEKVFKIRAPKHRNDTKHLG